MPALGAHGLWAHASAQWGTGTHGRLHTGACTNTHRTHAVAHVHVDANAVRVLCGLHLPHVNSFHTHTPVFNTGRDTHACTSIVVYTHTHTHARACAVYYHFIRV